MADGPESSASGPVEGRERDEAGLVPQLRLMLGVLRAAAAGPALAALGAGLLLVICATAYGQIRLNRWNQPFYDALSRRDFHDFLVQLGTFCVIAGAILVLNVAQRWLGETLKVRMREALVLDLLRGWMAPRRAFWLAHTSPLGVNPDQRMHEDARKLAELSADLAVGLLQASILLVSFVGVLWVISSHFIVRIAGRELPIPGYMVWSALIYALAGSWLSYRVGRSLVPRNAERYAREADLRFSLIRVNEHLDGISLAGGEAGELRTIEQHLAAVLAATRRLVLGLTHLTWVTAGFGWIMIVAPILVAAPLYFTGEVSFGGLMMAAAAFTQAQSSLRWFVDNFSVIADWRATLLRVASFHRVVVEPPQQEVSGDRIAYARGPVDRMVIEDLEVHSNSSADRLRERRVEIARGERILILAERGTGRTQLFRALAGLWPWGRGQITAPSERVLYFPRGTPYLPRGPLCEVLAYPFDASRYSDAAFASSLMRLGLERLTPLLHAERRWDRDLSQDEQLSLAFARILLHAPAWLLIDNTFGTLDGETLDRLVDIFANELAQTSVIHIGTAEARDPLCARVVHLIKIPARSAPLPREAARGADAAAQAAWRPEEGP